MRHLALALAISALFSGSALASFLGYVTISHDSSNLLKSDTTVFWNFDVLVCADGKTCRYQMIGDHKIIHDVDGDIVSIMQWGVYGGEYRGHLDGPGVAESCYSAYNDGTFYLIDAGVGYIGPPLPITLGTGGPWTNVDCLSSPCTSCTCSPTFCERSETCPLILDLNQDGIHATGLADPVHVWIDLQGRIEATAWTDPRTEEGFLWLDLNNDDAVQVTELFGSRMTAPNGSYHANGFEALAKYDTPAWGGDGDGKITRKDRVWNKLRLWVDRNHDGISQPSEISTLEDHDIVALNLAHYYGDKYDENGNELYLVGSYVVRLQETGNHGGNHQNNDNLTAERLMADIEFKFIPNK